MMMSSANPEHAAPPSAPRAGADLRAARERLGWSLPEVAAGLRIRQPHLEALEEGRIDLLPAAAYALGFLRTYASALGLDPDEIARRFKAEAGEVTRRTELAFPAPMPERGIPAGAVVLLGLVLAVGAYAGWYRLSGEGRLPAETVTVPERLAPLAQQALPAVVPPAPKQVATGPTQAAASEEPPPPVPALSPTSAAAASMVPGSSVAAAAASAPNTPAASGLADASGRPATAPQSSAGGSLPIATASAAPLPPAAAASLASADAPPVGAGANPPPQVVLHASADAWVQVRDKSGQVLLNRILHAGDSWPVPPDPSLLLTTGNAGGTELVVGGTSTGALGNPGAVRRDLPLDPQLIKEGRLDPHPGSGIQPASIRGPSR